MKKEISRDTFEARDEIDNKLNQIQALAGILGTLAYYQYIDPDHDSEAFRFNGEQYCNTIETMAREAKERFKQIFSAHSDHHGELVLPVEALESRLAFLKNSAQPRDLQHVEDSLKEIDDIMARWFIPVARMKAEFEAVRERIMKANKAAGAVKQGS